MNKFWIALAFCVLIISPCSHALEESIPLDGAWKFALDPNRVGLEQGWQTPDFNRDNWRIVTVPHTWNIEPGNERFFGVAWYSREFRLPSTSRGKHVILAFDAVYRDAHVYVNGTQTGEHRNSGWTPFQCKIPNTLLQRGANTVTVRVDNTFSATSLPYLDSFDWANDGGIIRSARITLYPHQYIEKLHIDALPTDDFGRADLHLRTSLVNTINANATLLATIYSPDGKLIQRIRKNNCDQSELTLSARIEDPLLWHFDFPHLYTAHLQLMVSGKVLHDKTATFGIRRVEVKDGYYYLNGEPMRLMGVEWMPGSDPRYGMAESPHYMANILEDMKNLNCIITRFHWQQDRSVFEFMDRNGMLTQEEVPSWGGKTIQGDTTEAQITNTIEMINAHYNHPSIYAWGLCNEIGEKNASFAFVQRGRELALAIDPYRIHTHASNGLQAGDIVDNAKSYASSLVEFIEWNDYWESWYGGDLKSLKANLLRIQEAFPDKSLVISEYGLCECNPKNPSGDERRIEILKTHTDIYRQFPNVAGAIFFDYNDYRTHIGDKGQGAFQQRVHGVVDLFGNRKPSWAVLRKESSPIKTLQLAHPTVTAETTSMDCAILTRSLENDLPAYSLREYTLTWIAYNQLGQPMGTGKTTLPNLSPGSHHTERLTWPTFENLDKVRVEIFRPTGYSVEDVEWVKP